MPLSLRIPVLLLLLCSAIFSFVSIDQHAAARRIASELHEAVFEIGDER
jgi:hypothetical protein